MSDDAPFKISTEPWLPFDRRELPATMTPGMEFASQALSVCLDELRRFVGFYELFIALKTLGAGKRGVNDPFLNSLSNIDVSLLRNMIIIIPALYDNDSTSTNVRRIVNTITNIRSHASLYAFHLVFQRGQIALDKLFRKLRGKQRIIRSSAFKKRLERISDARNKLVHITTLLVTSRLPKTTLGI